MAKRQRFKTLKAALKLMRKGDGTVLAPPQDSILDKYKDNLSREKIYKGLRGISRVKTSIGIYPFYRTPTVKAVAPTTGTSGTPGTPGSLVEVKYTSRLIVVGSEGDLRTTVATDANGYSLAQSIINKANHQKDLPMDKMPYGFSPAKAIVYKGDRQATAKEVTSLITTRKYNVTVKGHSLTLPFGQDADSGVEQASDIFVLIQNAAKAAHKEANDVVQVTYVAERFQL